MKYGKPPQVRATISFPAEVYKSLEIIAKEKKVSLAWIVREATERYLSDKWPLFASTRDDNAAQLGVQGDRGIR
jgi:hypothetical protein